MRDFNFEAGTVIDGRYKLERKIGDGGSAVVYLADDTLIGRKVAVKILKDDGEETNTKSFLTEAQAVSLLSHPNIVNVYDVAVKDDMKYIVMEYVDGITLRKYMDHNGTSDAEEVINCASQVLTALIEAHSHGIVHRDIKPQNIMLLKNGTIKVADFGIAKLPSGDELSMEGRAVGTVYYISPEQAKGKPVDERSDIYSLGVMMYEMATGSLPFEGPDPSAVAMKQITDTPRRPCSINPDIPRGLEQVILAAMEKDPENRFQSADAMLKALDKLADDMDHVFKNLTSTVKKPKTEAVKGKIVKMNVIIPIIAGVVLALGVAVALIVAGTMREQPPVVTDDSIIVEIPPLVGRIYTNDSYGDYLANQHLDISAVYVYSDKYVAGTVLNQSIEAGSSQKISPDASIPMVIYVSLGARPIELGTVEGNYVDVIAALEKQYSTLNFKVIRVWEYSDTVPEDNVISWESTTSVDVIVGSIITLHISAGPESEKYTTTVPKLVGMNIADAIIEIEKAGLHVGNIEYVISTNSSENKVITQSRAEGSVIFAKVNTIDLTVGGGLNYGK